MITAAACLATIYAFVVTVDPWDVLPLSPPLPRVPISSNARYSFPALARSPAFDSVVLGTSSARLLRPDELNPGFGARFANLSMNSATAYEQSRMLDLFRRWHRAPRAVIVAIDQAWCSFAVQRFTPRPFPEWMYDGNPWAGYREMLTPFAVQEAWNQAMVMAGLKRRRYGLDGYTSFVPPDAQYDPARRDRAFERWPPLDTAPAPKDAEPVFPALPLLDEMLADLPPSTRKVLYVTPYHLEHQGAPGSVVAWGWARCKEAVAAIARRRGADALDFQIPSAITRDRDNFWDPVHYRQSIATRITEALVRGTSPDAVTLAGSPGEASSNGSLADD